MTTKSALIASLFLAAGGTVYSQTAPDTLWTRTYGGASSDGAMAVRQTNDGGFIVAGSNGSFSAGGADVWLLKIDEAGSETWSRTFGGARDDFACFVEQTADSGYILLALTKSFGDGSEDIWLIKTDRYGIETWNRRFGGLDNDRANSVRVTSDGGYILAGKTGNYATGGEDLWLIKTDEDGIEDWNRTYGGTDNEKAYLVQETTEGGYITAGYTESHGNGESDVWLVKTDEAGTLLWDRTFGGPGHDNAYYVQQTTDGGYILAGRTASFGMGEIDVWVIKTDANGDSVWSDTYGGPRQDVAYAVQETVEGNFILAGLTNSHGTGDFDVWLIKTDGNGNEIWNGTYGGSNDEFSFSVHQTADCGYVAAGRTNSFGSGGDDAFVVRLEPDEIPTPTTVSSFGSHWRDGFVVIEWSLSDDFRPAFDVFRREAPDGTFVKIDAGTIRVNGDRFSFRDGSTRSGTTYTYRVVVIEDGIAVTSFETTVDTPAPTLRLDQNEPNPFNPTTRIRFVLEDNDRVTLSIFDVKGNRVTTLIDRRLSAGAHAADWDGRDDRGNAAPSGVYIYRLAAGKRTLTRKAVLLR